MRVLAAAMLVVAAAGVRVVKRREEEQSQTQAEARRSGLASSVAEEELDDETVSYLVEEPDCAEASSSISIVHPGRYCDNRGKHLGDGKSLQECQSAAIADSACGDYIDWGQPGSKSCYCVPEGKKCLPSKSFHPGWNVYQIQAMDFDVTGIFKDNRQGGRPYKFTQIGTDVTAVHDMSGWTITWTLCGRTLSKAGEQSGTISGSPGSYVITFGDIVYTQQGPDAYFPLCPGKMWSPCDESCTASEDWLNCAVDKVRAEGGEACANSYIPYFRCMTQNPLCKCTQNDDCRPMWSCRFRWNNCEAMCAKKARKENWSIGQHKAA